MTKLETLQQLGPLDLADHVKWYHIPDNEQHLIALCGHKGRRYISIAMISDRRLCPDCARISGESV